MYVHGKELEYGSVVEHMLRMQEASQDSTSSIKKQNKRIILLSMDLAFLLRLSVNADHQRICLGTVF